MERDVIQQIAAYLKGLEEEVLFQKEMEMRRSMWRVWMPAKKRNNEILKIENSAKEIYIKKSPICSGNTEQRNNKP